MLPGAPTAHTEVSGFNSVSNSNFLLIRKKYLAQVLGSLPPHGRSRLNSRLTAPAWHSPASVGIWGTIKKKDLCLSLKEINYIYGNMENVYVLKFPPLLKFLISSALGKVQWRSVIPFLSLRLFTRSSLIQIYWNDILLAHGLGLITMFHKSIMSPRDHYLTF